MNTRSNDPRRGRGEGNQGYGHDPRRGSSSPQWNRESQMQHEQFMPRHGGGQHGGQQGGFEGGFQGGYGGYGGGFGGPEGSYGRGDEGQRDWRSGRYDDRDFETAYGQSGQRGFSGYGDYDQDFEESRRGYSGSRGSQGNLPWMRRGQGGDEFGREEHMRGGGSGGHMRHHDPDYDQW